jgi:Sulfotransferase family
MPNSSNATRPVTLVGLGRSGTTLLEACFKAHPRMQTLNETSGLIFGLAAGAFESPLPAKSNFTDPYSYAGFAIRTALTALEPSDKPFWFHKPGGLPKLINWEWQEGRRTGSGFPVEWYWRIMKAAFPGALFVTSLRNPWDVVLSWERYIGWRQEDVWQDVADIYEMLDTGSANIGCWLFFDDLVAAPDETLRRVLSFAGIPFHPAVVSGFRCPQAMRPGHSPKPNHQEDWHRCIPPPITPAQAARIVKVWSDAGRSFQSPERFADLFCFGQTHLRRT